MNLVPDVYIKRIYFGFEQLKGQNTKGILHSILWVLLDYNKSNICTCNNSL